MSYIRILSLVALLTLVAGCGGQEHSTKVAPMQSKDKRLSCKEILLEMNEAEFYRKMAYKNKGPKMKNILMPLGYISTYVDAEEAIDAAEARVSYLERIYEIMKCADKDELDPKEISASVDTSYYSSKNDNSYQAGNYQSPYSFR